jgi:GAF domain-containing protein
MKTQVHQSLMDDSDKALWREAALAHGFQSSIALPLKQSSGAGGALTLYARERDAFTEEEVRLLEELADDLAFGIATLGTRAERDRMAEAHQHHEEILRKSLEDSIQAISDTVVEVDHLRTWHGKIRRIRSSSS